MGYFVYWQSVADRLWYWRLLDAEMFIRATGHQGFPTALVAWTEMNRVEYICGDGPRLPRRWIADPNARVA